MNRWRASTLRKVVNQLEGLTTPSSETQVRASCSTLVPPCSSSVFVVPPFPSLSTFSTYRSVPQLQLSANRATAANVTELSTVPANAAYIADVRRFWETCKRDLRNVSLAVACVTKRLLPGGRLAAASPQPRNTPNATNVESIDSDMSSLQSTADVVAFYVARRITPDDSLLAVITSSSVNLVETSFDADALATILQGLVLFGYHPSKADISIICESVRRNANQCHPSAAVSILCALSSFQHRDEALLECLCAQLTGQVNLLEVDVLPQILWFCSTLRYSNPRLVDVVVAKTLWEVNQLGTTDLAQIVVSLANLRHKDAMTDVLLDAVAETTLKRLPSCSNKDLSDLCWGYAKLEHTGPLDVKLFEAVLRKVMIAHQGLDAPAMVNLLWAVAKLDYQNSDTPHLLDWLVTSIKSTLSRYSTQQMVDLLWALSKLRYYDSELYQEFAVRITRDLEQLTGRHLADLLFSYANVNYHPGPLLDKMVDRAIASLQDMTARELCNTLWSLAMLDELPPTLFGQISECLSTKRLEDLRPQHLQRAFQAELLSQPITGSSTTAPSLPEWLSQHARRSWQEHVYYTLSSVSRTQQEVSVALSQIGVPCEMVKIIEDGLLVVDIVVEVPGHPKVAVEVSEYTCFSCNKPYTPIGTALFSGKFLRSRGWQVVNVYMHEWLEAGDRKLSYLRKLLQQVDSAPHTRERQRLISRT